MLWDFRDFSGFLLTLISLDLVHLFLSLSVLTQKSINLLIQITSAFVKKLIIFYTVQTGRKFNIKLSDHSQIGTPSRQLSLDSFFGSCYLSLYSFPEPLAYISVNRQPSLDLFSLAPCYVFDISVLCSLSKTLHKVCTKNVSHVRHNLL